MSLLDRWLARQLAGQLSQLVSWPAGRLAAWLPASPPVRLSGLLVADQLAGWLAVYEIVRGSFAASINSRDRPRGLLRLAALPELRIQGKDKL